MEQLIHGIVTGLPLWALFAVLAVFIYLLGKGADILVDEAVALSLRLRIPTVLIGATVVSLGTTLPEAAVSVFAAVQGNPDLALGNAVGSIICDTGLILGIGALMRPLPLNRAVVNKQGYVQLGSGLLLVLLCIPWSTPGAIFTTGGHLPQVAGFLLLGLLVIYFFWSYRLSRTGPTEISAHGHELEPLWKSALLLVVGAALVIISSQVVIPTASEIAFRLHVPKSIVAASLVALGTSLPELVTVVTSVRKGQGELAVGNVIGADILNVFFVAGASAAVTSGGLAATPVFFTYLFPVMLGLLLVFRIGIWTGGDVLSRKFGLLLLVLYLAFLVGNVMMGGVGKGAAG